MGLFSRKKAEPVVPVAPVVLEGRHELCVVGESFYQDALGAIVGPKEETGCFLAVLATLERQPDNPYDANAVGVYIDRRHVGHIPRDIAPDISRRLAARRSPCIVHAHINGGWKTAKDEGSFGVVLHMPDPDDI